MKKRLKTVLIIAVVSALLVFVTDSRLKIVHYSIKSDEVSNEIKLALITDLHNCGYGKNQQQLLKEIDKEKPDAILLGGDIFDDDYITENAFTLIESLADDYKLYYVSGNHEWWSGDMYELFGYLDSVGVITLRGESDVLEVGDSRITICGIDDPAVIFYDEEYADFDEQLASVGKSLGKGFNLLLSHRPNHEDMYFDYDFDLVLSGHAHGGQVRIPFLLNGLYAPNQGLFPRVAGGRYDFENGTMIVSRGLSRENTIVPRVFNRPELVFVSIGG